MIGAVKRRPRLWALIVLGLVAGIAFWRCLPEPLFDSPYSVVLLDRNATLLGARIAADEQWRFPPDKTLPEKFSQALVTFEDKRFYSHPGVDPLAVSRALYSNIRQARIVSGASTLSMQVIRLARRNRERSYWEKLIEMILALRLELRYDKAQILALHAAHAPFGGNVVGLEAASWRYFGRSPQQLSWAESCTLAVLPNSPSLIHPGKNRHRLQEKRDALLQDLHREGIINTLDLELALAEPLPQRPLDLPHLAPHLLETLRAQDLPPRLHSTLDKPLQEAAQAIVQQHAQALSLKGVHNAAALIIDNENFEVLAYIGNSGIGAANAHGQSIDITRRARSTGSILKPLLFASMLQSGDILPTTLVPDIPTQYSGYIPNNYDRRFRGAVSAQDALARSLNVPAVRMLRMHGVNRFYDFLQQMGMSSLHRSADGYGLTLILGGAEGSLWDLAGMYSNLTYIAKDRQDAQHYHRLKVLTDADSQTKTRAQIGAPAAWLTLDALLQVTRPGLEGHWRNFSSSRKIAWKTGTSYGLRDAWAIGSDARHTVAVWVGNASGEGRAGLTGLGAAAPILFDLFNRLPAAQGFDMPRAKMKQIDVCQDDGFLYDGKCATRTVWIAQDSHFSRISAHHVTLHLDHAQTWRVHGDCYPVHEMIHKTWFILPPAQAYYYRRYHADYRKLPPMRRDCRDNDAVTAQKKPIALLYPAAHSRVYIPVDLDGKKSKIVFEAVHRDSNAILYWHLDEDYLGYTQTYHQLALDIAPGHHRLTLVDEQGKRLSREFEVLGKQAAGE